MLISIAIACGTPGLDDMLDEDAVVARLEVQPLDEVLFARAPEGVLVSEELLISNVGDVPALFEGAWLEGTYADDFTVYVPAGVPGRIKPGQDLVISVQFAASAIGRFPADLFLSTPETATGGITRALLGRGCTDADRDDRCD